MNTKLIAAIVAAGGLTVSVTAQAFPVIGFDPTGTGTFTTYADIWTNITDTGIDHLESGVGLPPTIGDVHSFHTQERVGTMSLNGVPVTPLGLNFNGAAGFELTKQVSFDDVVTGVTFGGTGTTLAFGFLADAYTNLTLYYDPLGDGSQAIPGGSATTVRCYGAGVTACGGPDGVIILEANLISNTSTFTAAPPIGAVGTGSFDLTFEITFHDPLYIDLSNLLVNGGTGNPIFADRFTGTLTQPTGAGVPVPAHAWDGTAATAGAPLPGNQLFKIDSSQSFAAVPEPSSLALLGVGLLASLLPRRRKYKAAG